MSVLSFTFRGSPLSRSCSTTPNTVESIEVVLPVRFGTKYRVASNERKFFYLFILTFFPLVSTLWSLCSTRSLHRLQTISITSLTYMRSTPKLHKEESYLQENTSQCWIDAGFIDGLTERRLYKVIMHFLEEQVDGNGSALAVCLSGRWHSLRYFVLPRL